MSRLSPNSHLLERCERCRQASSSHSPGPWHLGADPMVPHAENVCLLQGPRAMKMFDADLRAQNFTGSSCQRKCSRFSTARSAMVPGFSRPVKVRCLLQSTRFVPTKGRRQEEATGRDPSNVPVSIFRFNLARRRRPNYRAQGP